MTHAKVLNTQTAAPEAAKILKATNEQIGLIPNLFGVLANTPTGLKGFSELMGSFEVSELSNLERQAVYLAASVENRGQYCVAGHTSFSDKLNLDMNIIECIRQGKKSGDKKIDQIVSFVKNLVRNKGSVSDLDIKNIKSVGYTDQGIIEIITGVAIKTITNYVDNSLGIPLDEGFKKYEWSPLDK